jgi:hypothetical protein
MVKLDRFGVSKERFCFVELTVLEDNLNVGQKFILILLIFIIIVNVCSFTFRRVQYSGNRKAACIFLPPLFLATRNGVEQSVSRFEVVARPAFLPLRRITEPACFSRHCWREANAIYIAHKDVA